MNLPDNTHFSKHLPDIQTTEDTRDISIDQVGISRVLLPVDFKTQNGKLQHTTASLTLTVNLAKEKRGIHMSRQTELLYQHIEEGKTFGAEELPLLAEAMLRHQNATQATVHLNGNYFLDVESPVSNLKSIAPIKVALTSVAKVNAPIESKFADPIVFESYVGIAIDGKTCCPCSREISDYDPSTGMGRGAHSQRGEITMKVKVKKGEFVWFEDLAQVANKAFSSPVYPLLKRVDERHVTMAAYANPGFVEDVIRNVAAQLDQWFLTTISSYEVQVENFESIHHHNAYASLKRSI